ncbi:MAG: DEAD/DEAH box helicase [Kyrpidia tusciae]|nr:SNF2-related protein [Kyrpidia tusciae]MBE3551602.1 DEAD/DEAH box helicase [Kyrpidia tusciae]
MNHLPEVEFNESAFDEFVARVREDHWDSWAMFQLALEAHRRQLTEDFDRLTCIEQLPAVIPYPHQLRTAERVLREFRGRAILADEVGLGKTIEAGLVLKEYLIRGLVQKALILVPASLVLQWTRELNEKFNIPAFAQRNEWSWSTYDILVASIDTTKRDPHRQAVLGQPWDMVIVDEAHKLKNRKTKNWQLVNQLQKKYCLLLTATPIQNDLRELYNLITLLKPGQLGSFREFCRNFVEDKRTPKNPAGLRKALDEVMIRNKRSEGNVEFTKRYVRQVPLQLSPEERVFYEAVTAFIREEYRRRIDTSQNVLHLITLQREMCSSPYAALNTLERMAKDEAHPPGFRARLLELCELGARIPAYTKVETTIDLVNQIHDKVIVFTEYRASQDFLLYMMKRRGIPAVPFRGGFQRGKKDWMKDIFSKRAQVMVATEAGGEGLNLQFCNQIINFDLPWNPMRVEQRIGRVHRLGQTRDVFIHNLATADTIEQYIVELLQEKIRLFELVIGELDLILGKMRLSADDFERQVIRWIMDAEHPDRLREKMDEFNRAFESAKAEWARERATEGVELPGLI